MYVHHVDGAPQIIHMECSPIRRNADRPRTAHFDQVTPGSTFRSLADESPLSVVGDGSPAAATVQSFMDLDEAQELPEEPTRPVDSPAESYDSHLEAFRPVQAGVFFGVEKFKGEPTFNGFSPCRALDADKARLAELHGAVAGRRRGLRLRRRHRRGRHVADEEDEDQARQGHAAAAQAPDPLLLNAAQRSPSS